MKLEFIKTNNHDINYIEPKRGQLLYCTDTEKIYYDNVNLYRINITLNSFIINTEKEKDSMLNPLINKVYIVLESRTIYSFDGYRWSQIELEEELMQIISRLEEFVSGVVAKDGKLYAPKTLASSVYMQDGTRLSANLNSSRILSVTKTKPVYIEATHPEQRVFNIPYPITDYDFKENHMCIFIKGDLLPTEKYIINNDKLILNKSVPGLLKGETILFIFYYTEHIDLNELVVLHTHNFANKSITSEKLSDNIRISAYNIIETIDRIFFSKDEQEKLKNIEDNATCYHHPKTHPASMIVQDAIHQFITEIERDTWNAKADANKVYTKEEVNKLIEDLIGGSPEVLDTLSELAKALGNDENFSTTISKELSKKTDNNEFEKLVKVVEKKVNIDDYVRSTIYGVPTVQNKLNCSYFYLNIGDPNFKQYIDGMEVLLKMNDVNMGNSFLSINGKEDVKILTVEGYELIPNELVQNSIYSFRYNGTTRNFILQGKGGVKITNTSQESYLVDKGQSIIRGDIVDVVNNKVIKALPRARILSNLETVEEKYYSESDIELFGLSENRFIIFWKFKKVFQVQVFNIIDEFVDISPLTLKKPIIISNDCIDFKVDIMENDNFILSYSDTSNKVNAQIVSIDNVSNIHLLTPYEKDENELVNNINIIYIKNNRAIIGWEYGNKTRCMLISTKDNNISIISGRDNIDYPLDSYCFVDSTQIMFCQSEGKIIKGWIMNISDNDFSNSAVVEIVTNKQIDFITPILSSIGRRQILSEWTDTTKTTFYRQYIEIDFKGRILYSEPYTIENEQYRILSNINKKYKHISEKYFINTSNMNYKMPSILGGKGDKCIKITISKIDGSANQCDIIETHTSINKVTADNISYDMVGNYMILCYNTKINKTDETHLYFAIADIRKIPYGVALSCANADEIIKIVKW